jgi:hypothetical protein
MAGQLRGSFEKFVDSPYSEKKPSPHLRKVPTRSNKVSPRTFQTAIVFAINLLNEIVLFSGSSALRLR